MTARLLDATLRDHITHKNATNVAFAVQSATPWTGPQQVEIKGLPVQVAQCRSILEMREYLSRWDHQYRLALITPIERVSDDLRARLFHQKLLTANAWDAVLQLLNARSVDVRLRNDGVLAEAVLDCLIEPPSVTPASGVLIESTVWEIILRAKLDLTALDAEGLVTWLIKPETSTRWSALTDNLRAKAEDYLHRKGGALFDALLGCLRADFQADAVAIGLAFEPLISKDAPPELERALGRMERFTSNVALTKDTAGNWFSAAEQVFRQAKPPDTIDRLDRILEAVQSSTWAELSTYSAVGTRNALDKFAQSPSEGQLRRLEKRHWPTDRQILERLAMILRLERWLADPDPTWVDFSEAVDWYRSEGSWIDWARSRLRVVTESGSLNSTIAALRERVRARREAQNRTFASLLARWVRNGSTEAKVPGVESVISRFVEPLVDSHLILFVVMDGMSIAIARELFSDFQNRRWRCWSPSGEIVAVAALPSVTQYSRTSLLSGALRSGTQNVELTGFEGHSKLKGAALFHKSDLAPAAENVLSEIANPNRKVVGIVINAIDDELSGSNQISPNWTLEYLSVLRGILIEAATAGRVVILTSDHGHTLDCGTAYLRQDTKSDRWRLGTAVSPDEQQVSGPRVMTGPDGFVGLAVESARYTQKPRNGYHGGLTPQECLVPVWILAQPGIRIKGSNEIVPEPPRWWNETREEQVAPQPRPIAQVPTGDWIEELLQSKIFKVQIDLAAGRVQAERVIQVVRVLADAGDRLLKPAFAQRLSIPLLRVSTTVAAAARVLNVDSYPVIELDEASQTVKLNRELLRKQFGLS